MSTIKNERAINDMIRAKEVRLVGAEGEQLGIMQRSVAQNMADEAGMDLVLIAPTAEPPVCRIMDYGKFKFEQAKHDKEVRKNQKTVDIKEVQLSATIEEHDLNVKARSTIRFLEDGNKIKVSIRFRGRQMAHTEIGVEMMNTFLERLEGSAVVDRKPLLEGRTMIMMLSPNKAQQKISKGDMEDA
ncbi:MAG: translation initiation factor IF-3 [Eubacteriales bacterium]|nr:translation initiation factor IF-3 [Eubacteriales bacterium]